MMFLLAKRSFNTAEGRMVSVPAGIYSQRQYLYQAMAMIEGTATKDTPAPDVIKLDFPHLQIAETNGKHTLGYARLCMALRGQGRLAIVDDKGEQVFVIWAMEMNETRMDESPSPTIEQPTLGDLPAPAV